MRELREKVKTALSNLGFGTFMEGEESLRVCYPHDAGFSIITVDISAGIQILVEGDTGHCVPESKESLVHMMVNEHNSKSHFAMAYVNPSDNRMVLSFTYCLLGQEFCETTFCFMTVSLMNNLKKIQAGLLNIIYCGWYAPLFPETKETAQHSGGLNWDSFMRMAGDEEEIPDDEDCNEDIEIDFMEDSEFDIDFESDDDADDDADDERESPDKGAA